MIYIHIGLPKTGTSAIQAYLNDNKKVLSEHGFVYPWGHPYGQLYQASSGNAGAIVRCVKRIPGNRITVDERCAKSVSEKLASFCSEGNLIISSESISVLFRSPAQLKIFLPEGQDVKIIVYLRNQIDKCISDVNQLIKNGDKKNYELDENWFDFNNYEVLLDRWASTFGKEKVVVRGYDRSMLKNGDVVSDFCDLIGLPSPDSAGGTSPVNPSLSPAHLELKRRVNVASAALFDMPIHYWMKDAIWHSSVSYQKKSRQKKVKGLKPTGVDRETLEEVVSRLSESNEKVTQKYGVSGLDLREAMRKYDFVKPGVGLRILGDVFMRLARLR